MKWYDKFQVGQEVRVIKKTHTWCYGSRATWVGDMDLTIGNVYKIIEINPRIGYRLDNCGRFVQNYWYPVESLQSKVLVGEQLLFNFMNEE